eukprot:scaffold7236_cov42-Prasinocladus_malaysianus.AAC.1
MSIVDPIYSCKTLGRRRCKCFAQMEWGGLHEIVMPYCSDRQGLGAAATRMILTRNWLTSVG